MKRYMLLRDIRFPIENIPEGTVFQSEEDERYYSAIGYKLRFTHREMMDKIWFEEVKEDELTIVDSFIRCKPDDSNLFVFTDNLGKKYSVDGKILRLLLSRLPEIIKQ